MKLWRIRKRGSQAASTILGGLALGGAGAIIGGVTAYKKHANKVKTIGLRIVANDTNNPIHEFQIIDFERYASTEEREYKENYNIAFEWYKTIEVLIHQADKEDEVNVKEGEFMSSHITHKVFVVSFFVLAIGGFLTLAINETLGTIMIFGSLFMIFLIFVSFSEIRKENEENFHKLIKDKKNQLHEFNIDKEYISKDDKNVVLVDEDKDAICFFDRNQLNDKFTITQYTYRDVLEIETMQDGNTITKTNRGSQIGGALLGGAVAGGVGAVIGGLSGSSTSEDKVSTLCLRVVVNDTDNPVRMIYFLKDDLGISKSEEVFIQNKKDLEYWYSLFKIYINIADKEDERDNESNSNFSVADEIKKYGDLLKEGLISQDEFDSKKDKLLSGSPD